jgi:hypothetical protein
MLRASLIDISVNPNARHQQFVGRDVIVDDEIARYSSHKIFAGQSKSRQKSDSYNEAEPICTRRLMLDEYF